MDFIIDAIVEWLKGLLVDGIMEIWMAFSITSIRALARSPPVCQDPADWNAGVFFHDTTDL